MSRTSQPCPREREAESYTPSHETTTSKHNGVEESLKNASHSSARSATSPSRGINTTRDLVQTTSNAQIAKKKHLAASGPSPRQRSRNQHGEQNLATRHQGQNLVQGLGQESFPFEKLPAEIRSMIYRYWLRCDRVDRVTVRTGRHRNDRAAVHHPWRKQYQFTLGILRVNRQTYHEAVSVLYRENQWVLYSETLGILRQNLSEVCFPLIRLSDPQDFGYSNSKMTPELKVRIEYNSKDGRAVSCFVVSRADAANVSRFILTDKTFLDANHQMTFNVLDSSRDPSFLSVFHDLHGMTSIRAAGLLEKGTSTKLLGSMRSRRQTAQHWISYGKAWLSRGDMNVEEFTRRGKEGVTKRYEAAMNSFECGWRETLVALHRIESGGLVCEASQEKELLDLQFRFALNTSRHCAHDSDRDVRQVQVTRASLRHFLEKASTTVEVKDLLQVLLNMARGGLDSHDHPLALYALIEALSLRPGHTTTRELLTELGGSFDKSWRSTTFRVQSLFNDLLSRDPHQKSSWSLIKPTSNNFVADAMQTLKRDIFDDVDI